MARNTLALACAGTGRSRPIPGGRVAVPGVDLVCRPGETESISVRAMALADLAPGSVLRVALPCIAEAHRPQAAILGGDPWPCGFARNREEVAAMIRYAVEDGLAGPANAPDSLFHPSTPTEQP
jgi:hypothetical protein